ncbi:MAG: hypothetical protein ACYS9X_01255 [Planctomycetota bacterium]
MPQAIAYCDRCAKLVPPGARKDAIISGETVVCAQCAAALSPEERAGLQGAPARAAAAPRRSSRARPQTSARRDTARTKTRSSRSQAQAVDDEGGPRGPALKQNLPVIVLSLAGVFVGVTFGILFLGGSPEKAPRPIEPSPRAGGPVETGGPPVGSPPSQRPPDAPPATVAPPESSGRASARLGEIRGWIGPDLDSYVKIRRALESLGKEFPGTAEAAEAAGLIAEVDARYAKLADEALDLAIVVGKGVAGTGDFRVAESGIRSIASRFGEGPWLESSGSAKIEKALAEIEKIRDLRRDREDPGHGIPPEQDTLALHVPEAAGYRLVYDLDLGKLGRDIRYFVDESRKGGGFGRVAYLVELYRKPDGEPNFVYVSMKAFTDDLTKIGVPTYQSRAKFQCAVSGMTVVSNVDGIETGSGLSGWIEFWASNYGTKNSGGVPGASDREFDFGDQPNGPPEGYGSMQVHNPSATQTLFAINKWKAGRGADIGIGNSTGKTRDWTFTGKAGTWPRKRLRVLVK